MRRTHLLALLGLAALFAVGGFLLAPDPQAPAGAAQPAPASATPQPASSELAPPESLLDAFGAPDAPREEVPEAALAEDLDQLTGHDHAPATLRVVSPDGAPLEGVRLVERESPRKLHHTDAAGRVRLPGDELTTWNAELAGYRRAAFTLRGLDPGPSGGPLLVLTPVNVLVVHVESPHEGLVQRLDLRIDARLPIFADTDAWAPTKPLPNTTLSRPYRHNNEEIRADGYCAFSLRRRQTVRVQDLRPGQPLRLSVRDAVDDVVLEREIAGLDVHEHRTVRLLVFEPGGRVAGYVRDSSGAPIAGASIEVRGETGVGTDPNGYFELGPLYAASVDAHVSQVGFVPRLLTLPVGASEEVELVLEPGRRIEVRVRDEAGAPITLLRDLTAHDDDGREWQHETARGRTEFHIPDLPAGVVTLRVEVHGAAYDFAHDTRVPVAELVIPVQGRLLVDWELPRQLDPRAGDARAVVRDPSGERVVHWRLRNHERSRLLQPFAPGDYDVSLETRGDRKDPWARALGPVRVGVGGGEEARALLRERP